MLKIIFTWILLKSKAIIMHVGEKRKHFLPVIQTKTQTEKKNSCRLFEYSIKHEASFGDTEFRL